MDGAGPDRLFGGSDNISSSRQPVEDLWVTFDGRANDGRRRERDHVGDETLKARFSAQSGRVAVVR